MWYNARNTEVMEKVLAETTGSKKGVEVEKPCLSLCGLSNCFDTAFDLGIEFH